MSAGGIAPWAIGSTLTFCILVDGPLTGAALNPARTLGPNLYADAFWSTPNTMSHGSHISVDEDVTGSGTNETVASATTSLPGVSAP